MKSSCLVGEKSCRNMKVFEELARQQNGSVDVDEVWLFSSSSSIASAGFKSQKIYPCNGMLLN